MSKVKKTILFTECEHYGDLENYVSDLQRSGATIISQDLIDDETGVVLIEVDEDYYERFTEHFSDTDSFEFSSLNVFNKIIQIDIENIIALLPAKVNLTYVDRNDNLNESFKEVQNAIHSNSFEELDMLTDTWFMDQAMDSVKEIVKNLRNSLIDKYQITKKESKAIIEKHIDLIKDAIYSRNESDLLKDLFSNTSKFIMHYDTGYEMESESWNWDEERIQEEIVAIKKQLQIVDDKYDSLLDIMISQATYGGQLVIFFRVNPYDMITHEDPEPDKLISFTNPQIAIINTYNGSADNCYLHGHKLSLDFNRENLFIEKTIHYNYTYAVCGMSEDWCDSTQVLIEEGSSCEKIEKSKTNNHLEEQAKYDEIFKNGGCTYGDKLMGRHRSITYNNNFPCGHTCGDCQTFWVD